MKRIGLVLIAILAVVAVGQEVTTKKAPVTYASPSDGQQLYVHYCGSCHGVDLKGTGPASSAMKGAVPDLTTWAKRNGGKFDAQKMVDIVTGVQELPAHGTKDMPVWGQVLDTVYPNKAVTNMAVDNLVQFIKAKQVQ